MRKLPLYDIFPADVFLLQGSRYRWYSASRLELVFPGLDEKAILYTGAFSVS